MVYLNNAATSFPKPQPVIDAVTGYVNRIPISLSRGGSDNNKLYDQIRECREKLSTFLNIKTADRIIFTSGGTESLNLGLLGVEYKNEHIITTVFEHNSVYRPLKYLEKAKCIELSIVDCDNRGDIDPADIKKLLKKNTKVVVVNHCSNVTGRTLDLTEIGRIVHSFSDAIFIVDASQSVGVHSIDIKTMDIDVLAFTGHKFLYGTQGIGGIYIREGLNLTPLKFGGTGVFGEMVIQPEMMPHYYEAGTPNIIGILSLSCGLDFINSIGTETIRKRIQHHTKRIYSELCNTKGVEFLRIGESNFASTMVSFNIRGMSPGDIGYILENSFEIIVRTGLHCAPLLHNAFGTLPHGSIRISPSFFTTDNEIDYFINAVKQICSEGASV